jgi:hypothetical protein
METNKEDLEVQLEDYKCTGRYCQHETSDKHYVIDLDFIKFLLSTQEEKIRKEHFEKLGEFAIERLISEPWDDMQKGWNNAWGLLLTKCDEEITK